jgi:putative MATE family efflux protein
VATNLWIGLLASLLIGVFAGPILRKAGLKPELITYALPFLSLMGGSLFLEAVNISISAVLRAHTHTRDAMLVVVGQNILNVIGNALLLFGLFGSPKLGVLGVAISCVLSRAFAFVALAIILARRTGIRIHLRDLLRIPMDNLKRILHIGLPAAGENLSWWLAFMVVTLVVVKQLPAGIATQSYTLQIVQWVILLNVAIGLGTEIVVGHLVGAGDYQEANRELLRNLRTGFLLAMGGAVLLATAGPYVIRGFTHDATIIATATVLFRLGLVIEPGRVFNLVVINSLRATGDARFPVLMGMCSMWGVWLPLAWLLGLKLGLGLTGVWIAMACDEWLRGLMMYRRWKQQHWMTHARQSRAKAIAGVVQE